MNPEDLLTDVLRAKAEDADRSGTPLATVTGHARNLRSVRRRRVVSVLGAAAAVVAVAATTTVLLGGGETADAPTGPTPTTPSVTQSADPLRLAALPHGRPPGIDYLVGDTYVSTSGGRFSAPDLANAFTATPVRGGILISRTSRPGVARKHGDLAPLYLFANGTMQSLGCGSGRFALSTDGTQSAYWVADSCSPGAGGKLYSGVNNTMGESGTAYVPTPAGTTYEPIGILRQGTVVNVSQGSAVHAAIVDASGVESAISSLAFAEGSDENNDVVAGALPSGNAETSAVVDAQTGAVLWRSAWDLGQFSPDGKYLVGAHPGDAFGNQVAILDATTGRELVTFVDQAAPVWDVNDTLLSVEHDGQATAIVRTDLQGHRTLATPIVHGDPFRDGYRLAARP